MHACQPHAATDVGPFSRIPARFADGAISSARTRGARDSCFASGSTSCIRQMSRLATTHAVRGWLLTLAAAFLTACATMPPGADYPKIRSTALAHPEETTVGRSVEALAKAHPGLSGFRLFASGSDAFTLRIQMANRAERTLDVQYFIFKDDDTGQLLMSAMLHAASRGVRVRVLMDDSQARGQDDRVGLLAANPNVEVRLYNPFYYRGSNTLLRYTEFALTMNRLDYRMH